MCEVGAILTTIAMRCDVLSTVQELSDLRTLIPRSTWLNAEAYVDDRLLEGGGGGLRAASCSLILAHSSMNDWGAPIPRAD